MVTEDEFVTLVQDAYQHLYDLVHLRTHPPTNLRESDDSLRPKEKAWRLHQALLDMVDELDPGPQAPVFPREWRRHRLVMLRYVDGLQPEAIANELAISRRHCYREHDHAINDIAKMLWSRTVAQRATSAELEQGVEKQAYLSRLELLRLEASRAHPYAITLYLMMPDDDGWDLLQTLVNQPETGHMPVIVCTVLKLRHLALSLGATLFLEKPITEQELVSALDALSGGTVAGSEA